MTTEHPAPWLQLKLLLRDVHPAVWRRVRLPDSLSISDLHKVIQLLMGWDDDHLHGFRIHGGHYGGAPTGGPDCREDAAAVPLSWFGFRPTKRFLYEYDFTAGWRVEVRVETVSREASGERHRIPFCIAGREPGPPDGCGGPRTYAERRRDAVSWEMTNDMAARGYRRPAPRRRWRRRRPERSRDVLGLQGYRDPLAGPGTLSGRCVPARRDQCRVAAGVQHSAGFPMIRMAVQVVFIDDESDQRDVHEIAGIDRDRLCPAALGLSLAEAKEIAGGIQQALVGVQVAEWQADQRTCIDCGNRRSLKGHHPIVFRTAFGTLRLDSERIRLCPWAQKTPGSVSPLADLLRERVSPEMLYLETKFASLVWGCTLKRPEFLIVTVGQVRV